MLFRSKKTTRCIHSSNSSLRKQPIIISSHRKVSFPKRIKSDNRSRFKNRNLITSAKLPNWFSPITNLNVLSSISFSDSPSNFRTNTVKPRLNTIIIENYKIKDKLKKYDKIIYEIAEDTLRSTVSYECLKPRFNIIADKIKSMLAREPDIETVKEYTNYDASLLQKKKRNYKIKCYMEIIPLKIYIKIRKSTGSGKIMFSQFIQRPIIDNCDKSIIIGKEDLIAIYDLTDEKLKKFNKEFIYFTIETEKTVILTFQCVFGKSNFIYYQR